MTELPQDDRKNPGIKRSYYPLPDEDPAGWRCVEVHIPDGDEYMELLRTALKSLALWYNYSRDISHRGKLIADRFAYALQLPELGCDMNCEELTECLAPLFESVDQIKQMVEEMKAQIEQSLGSNAAKLPAPMIDTSACNAAYAGALALVVQMHKNNLKYYAEAEDSFVDNASEALAIVLELFDKFRDLPYDEAFEIGNLLFTTLAAAYASAYDAMAVPAACDLMQKVVENGGVLTVDVWGTWLNGLDTLIPDNAASQLFAKFSPIRQTFINQIAEKINGEQSLQSYFEDLWQVYFAGTKVPVTDLPEGCDCLLVMAQNVGIISECGTGTKSSVEFEDGVPFDIVAYEDTGITGQYTIALKLPPGEWNVTLNSITGTITPPASTTQTAYAWNDAGGFHKVQWDAPAAPDEFGEHDTVNGSYAPWCSTQEWNAALFNDAPFTANFTATAI